MADKSHFVLSISHSGSLSAILPGWNCQGKVHYKAEISRYLSSVCLSLLFILYSYI